MSDAVQTATTPHGDPPAASTARGRADRKELASFAVERTRMPMVIADARHGDHPIVLANQAFLDLTGYGAEEVVGRNCRFLQGAGTSDAAIAKIRAAVAAGQECDVEILNYRKDGSDFWNQLHLSPVHDEAGQLLYIFASQRDVSDFRKVRDLEAAERRLLREVDHRAMNALAIVEGIVRLSCADDPSQYAAAIQRRVQALASAHALLGRQAWRDVQLEELLRTQVEGYAGRRIAFEGPPIEIGAALVQPLALVLHEMAANASRHGALSAPDGEIRLGWSRGPGEGLVLTWTEIGGPPPAAIRPRGFGATMISAIVERQLGGQALLAWRPEGLAARFVLPRRDRIENFRLSAATEDAASQA
uniref:histidine kinase n=1 Tax=Caulobacter sp. (strain K31) TaxID=366602 RepID=B0T3W0_CAUSK